jgi:hypothetical protein
MVNEFRAYLYINRRLRRGVDDAWVGVRRGVDGAWVGVRRVDGAWVGVRRGVDGAWIGVRRGISRHGLLQLVVEETYWCRWPMPG